MFEKTYFLHQNNDRKITRRSEKRIFLGYGPSNATVLYYNPTNKNISIFHQAKIESEE